MERSIDTILSKFNEMVSTKQAVSPDMWVEASQLMAVLIGNETDKLYDLQQQVNQMKADLIAEGQKISAAKIIVEATDIYKEMCKQKAKIENVTEFIRIAKLRARLLQDEIRGQW